jgi:hypothetical protein
MPRTVGTSLVAIGGDSTVSVERITDTEQRASLYAIIDQLRREHPSGSAIRTLDMVVRELGYTQDNLREALAHLEKTPLPPGGERVLSELKLRAWLAGVDNLRTPVPPEELRASLPPLDWAEIGIAIMLGGSALIVFVLGLWVTIRHPVG